MSETREAFSGRTGLFMIPTPTPFPVGPANVFLLKGDPLTLIDTGTRTDQAEEALRAGLNELGVSFADIERLMLSHHHVDHTGLAGKIVEESGAEVWAHPLMVEQFTISHSHDDAARQFFMDIMHAFGVPEDTAHEAMTLWRAFRSFMTDFGVDHAFVDGETAGPFRTYFVPGHSATDTLLVNETDGYTIVADHILEVANPNPLIRRPKTGEPRAKALVEYTASLAKSRALALGRCFPGHGDDFPDAVPVIDKLTAKHDERNARILARIAADGPQTPHAIARDLYPKLGVPHLSLALSVAIGHLELLEDRGALVSERNDVGVLRYSVT